MPEWYRQAMIALIKYASILFCLVSFASFAAEDIPRQTSPPNPNSPLLDSGTKLSPEASIGTTKKPISLVPPGFENLLEPQTTQVDVYYGGAFLLSTLATFTLNDIRFLDPAAVAGKIHDLLDVKSLETLLAKELGSNSQLVCLTKIQTNCGKITPRQVEVIFDENLFRVDLFISQKLLSVRQASISKYLPESSSGLSLLNAVGATTTGRDGENGDYNISNSTTIAFKETRLLMISNLTKAEEFTVDTLTLEREINGEQYQAGLFRSSPVSMKFFREIDYLGFSFATSLDTRKDLDQSTGNELQLFLDSRSRVDILKDGRLLSTNIYDAGNQILDTSKLPGGAYDIVIRIQDNFGNTREEPRFYVKTNLLPPKDQPLYFFDIGEQVSKEPDETFPKKNGNQLLRAGVSKRLTDSFGGELGFVHENDAGLVEAGFFQLGRKYDLRANIAAGSDKSQGTNINTNFRLGTASVAANFRKTISDNRDSLIGSPINQGSLNLSLPLNRGSINFSARYNERQDVIDRNFGLNYSFPSYRFGGEMFSSSLQITKNNGDWLLFLGGRISKIGKNWEFDFSSRYYYDNPKDLSKQSGTINAITSNWQDGDQYLGDVRWGLSAIDEQDDETLETELEIASNYGRLDLDVVHSLANDTTNYGASLYTTILANRDTFSLGGKSQARSAVIVDIDGQVEDAFFTVEVNRIPKGYARIGEKTIISLPPFQSYNITLQPRGDSLVNFNNQTQVVTLYPGNVETLKWTAIRLLIAFGQIVDTSGSAIPNALIQGVIGLATTDETGIFQAEIESSTRQFQVRTRSFECTALLPEFDTSQQVVMLGKLVCINERPR